MSDRVLFAAKLMPAGAGALRYAGIWLLGAIAIGIVMTGAIGLVDVATTAHDVLVIVQALLVVAWLVFVVYRAVHGGRLELTADSLRIRHFIRYRSYRPNGREAVHRFVTHIQGRTYEAGPALRLDTVDGGHVTIACTASELLESSEVTDDQVVAPNAVMKKDDFVAFRAAVRGSRAASEAE